MNIAQGMLSNGYRTSLFFKRNESPNGSVVGSFHIVWEITRRQFPGAAMIFDALAAQSLATAWLIAAIATIQISLKIFTLHGNSRSISVRDAFGDSLFDELD